MTSQGKAYAMARLSDAPDSTSLRRVWESLGREYQECPEIVALKDTLKKSMEGQ